MSAGAGKGAASTRASRLVRASPSAVYAAFMDPAALVRWLPPGEMRGQLHAFDARVGGGYRMSLFYPVDAPHVPGKTTAHEDRVHVRFLELVPGGRILESVNFDSDDPALRSEMRIAITFEPVGDGTRVTMEFTDLPRGVRPEDNDAGARQSLEQLARYVEGG